MLEIPEKGIANPLFHQRRDQHAYLQERRDQQANGWAVDTHTGNGERDQQAPDQSHIVDGNREGRAQELPFAIEHGGGNAAQAQNERVQQHDTRERDSQSLFKRRQAGHEQFRDEGRRHEFGQQDAGSQLTNMTLNTRLARRQASRSPRCVS